MKKTLESYLYALIHPFKYQESIRNNIPIASSYGGYVEPIDIQEALAFSWAAKIIRGLIQIVFIFFFANTIYTFSLEDSEFAQQFIPTAKVDGYVFILIALALEVVFFPVFAMIFIELWKFMIKIYARLLSIEEDEDQVADEIMTASLSSHIFDIIPFVGEFAQKLSSMLIIYAGLRRNLRASKVLSFIILFTPLCLFFGFVLMFMLTIAVITL
jgi:hypothetical protein